MKVETTTHKIDHHKDQSTHEAIAMSLLVDHPYELVPSDVFFERFGWKHQGSLPELIHRTNKRLDDFKLPGRILSVWGGYGYTYINDPLREGDCFPITKFRADPAADIQRYEKYDIRDNDKFFRYISLLP